MKAVLMDALADNPPIRQGLARKSLPENQTFAVVIEGQHTDFVISNFQDRLLVIVTQYKKLGTLVSIIRDRAQEDDRNYVYGIKVLLGKDDEEIHVAARILADIIGSQKPVLLTLALKNLSPATVKTIGRALQEKKFW